MLGRKVLRFCPVLGYRVVCDGLCTVIFSVVVGSKGHLCPVREKSIDIALNR